MSPNQRSPQLGDDSKLIWNTPHGDIASGSHFKEVPSEAVFVSTIDVWTKSVAGDQTAIKAIRVTWNNCYEIMIGERNDSEVQSASFEESERIRKMIIFTGDWVDSIYYESTLVPFGRRLGGEGGLPRPQDVGIGSLVGFWGKSGSDVDALGSVFVE